MEQALINDPLSFLRAPGEMSALICKKDWCDSPLGPAEDWPQSLKTTIGIVLNSRFPMFLWWGPELVCLYNDAYRPSLGQHGKHPSILGMPAKEAWPEIWPLIKPLIDTVLAGEEATWSEDQLIPIYRNGMLEDVYWTFSYSAVKDESGQVGGVLVTCFETTEKVNGLRQLEESNRELAFAIEAAELGTFDFDPVNNKFSANNRLREWFDLPGDGQIDLPRAMAAIAEKDAAAVSEAIGRSMEYLSGGVFNIEYTVINHTTKKETIVHAKGNVSFDEAGKAYRLHGTLRDITEQKKFQHQLEQEVKDRTKELAQNVVSLGKLNKELQSFAYISSHDLQEPLRKIQTFASMLLDKEHAHLSDHGKDVFNRMQKSARRMQSLIEDLLAYSRTHASQEDFKRIDLHSLIEEVKQDFIEEINLKHATIVVGDTCDIKVILFQFRQLFTNLFSNALKFAAPERPLVVTVNSATEVVDEPQDEHATTGKKHCRIIVEDNGIGFDPQYNERIFELFRRLNGRSEYSGTGVGLAIVKRIIENHGGTITASGEAGKGARFEICVPAV